MSDLKDIAGKHIESAKNLEASSIKYIVGFILIILFRWYSSEITFNKLKYDIIKLNQLEQEIDLYKAYNGKLFKPQQLRYEYLKEKIKNEDSTTIEKYKKDIEENVPSIFKFILRQAIQRPYGILLTSIIILIFLYYLFNIRRNYLLKLSIGLRIIKNSSGYNEIYDYNIELPFWALPIPNNSINGVEKKDITIIGGLKRKATFHGWFIFLFIVASICIQFRLYYISLVTNSFLLYWTLMIQSIILLLSVLIVILWFLPLSIRDNYNHEIYVNPNLRRNFITTSSLLLTGISLGLFSPTAHTLVIHKLLKPRFVSNKRTKEISNCRKIELLALDQIKKRKFGKAASIIFLSINQPKHAQNYIRLFDLIIILCLKDFSIYQKYFSKIINIAKQSGVQKLEERSNVWGDLTIEKLQSQEKRKYWDNIEI